MTNKKKKKHQKKSKIVVPTEGGLKSKHSKATHLFSYNRIYHMFFPSRC